VDDVAFVVEGATVTLPNKNCSSNPISGTVFLCDQQKTPNFTVFVVNT